MTPDRSDTEEATKAELRAELRRTRSHVRTLENELAETNEGMVALTLELESARERYQTIFEESTDGILLIDLDRNTIHEANPQAGDLLGYDRHELVALSPSDIFPDEDERFRSFAEAVVYGWADGFTCRTKEGRKIDVDISASMVTLGGQSLLLASLRDVTTRKRREQRLQVLTRIFRHNLRNDGNVIQGHADLLYDELSDTELEGHVRTIRETIDELLRLSGKVRRIQDILDRNWVYPSPLGELLTHHREWFEQTHSDETLSVALPDREVLVGRRLGVAVQEAIENAAKHADGTSPIRVSAEIDEARETVRIEIADDGPGIPDHELEVMRSGAETPLAHSSGIGIWFINWVVDSLGGELAINRGDPTGTIISITVPQETEHPPSTPDISNPP